MRAAGVESEMELAFAALHQLCAPLLDLLPRLPGPQRAAMETVIGLVREEFFPAQGQDRVEVTETGHLRIPAALAARYFPSDACSLILSEDGDRAELLMVPLQSPANGGQLLKQRTSAGDRALLVRETLADDLPVGEHRIRWDAARGAVVVDLGPGEWLRDGRSA